MVYREDTATGAGLVLGEDWVRPQSSVDGEIRASRARRGVFSLYRSPLARKIVLFNLLALVLLIAGVLFTNPFREGLVFQRERAIVAQAELLAGVLSPQIVQAAQGGPVQLPGLVLERGLEVVLFGAEGHELVRVRGARVPANEQGQRTFISDFLNAVWDGLASTIGAGRQVPQPDGTEALQARVAAALDGTRQVQTTLGADGGLSFAVAVPIRADGAVVGVIAMNSAAGEIDALLRSEREQVLQIFVVALLVSIGLSMVLASTIANPIADLAAAAELGREKNARRMSPHRVRIPDLTARPDEIGRLSVAMRGMVGALYERIDANEQFAADVAHEIKNPLASLRSAVGTLRIARRDDQRLKLLDVIEHDVRRLDRLVSDTSNASRLDSELVKEEQERFNLVRTLDNLSQHLAQEAGSKGVEFISELPDQPIEIDGLEARLAQVFVNLITNAISFCEAGDAVRVWARRRDNRVLVVVEDTGPGIPDQALQKIFQRFYSERPVGQFGNHSGLGLAISKQIVEAHGGVIWAENIRPTEADEASEPLGARFVVGLPL
jgi:two-component system sensor histidine kinase ChvG